MAEPGVVAAFNKLIADETKRAEVASTAQEWALTHGMLLKTATGAIQHIPTTLFPTQYPKAQIEKAIMLQEYFNIVMHNIRMDTAYVVEVLKEAAVADPSFTGRMLEIFETVSSEPQNQTLSLSIHRNDYMLDVAAKGAAPMIKQVEVNTISCAFVGLGRTPAGLHRYLVDTFTPELSQEFNDASAPNQTLQKVAAAMATAVGEYHKRKPTAARLVICMVVQPGEKNAFDQRLLEYQLHEVHHISLLRKTLKEFHTSATIATDGTLTFGSDEVALCYFRAGYGPGDYPTEDEWTARALIERSMAIKAPSLIDHLTGAKKMQQVLAAPGVLERYTAEFEPSITASIRETFTGLYELGDTELGNTAVANALANPSRYVLKPQREGGGNNLYGLDAKKKLEHMSIAERSAYILMDLIQPPQNYSNMLLRQGAISSGFVVSELGIFGCCLSDSATKQVVNNSVCGTLLRTKFSDVIDGGVSAGHAVLDSPWLV
eukprot:m.179912 g.179912  ORF g.179912 m.179912 type:complete len:489 (-) comp31993_c0_seq1:38-1504(-)